LECAGRCNFLSRLSKSDESHHRRFHPLVRPSVRPYVCTYVRTSVCLFVRLHRRCVPSAVATFATRVCPPCNFETSSPALFRATTGAPRLPCDAKYDRGVSRQMRFADSRTNLGKAAGLRRGVSREAMLCNNVVRLHVVQNLASVERVFRLSLSLPPSLSLFLSLSLSRFFEKRPLLRHILRGVRPSARPPACLGYTRYTCVDSICLPYAYGVSRRPFRDSL